MKEEEYFNLRQILKSKRSQEIKKIKKESLLEFINETEKLLEQKEKKYHDELENARICIETFDDTQDVIKEYQDFIKELKTINTGLQEDINDCKSKLEKIKSLKNKALVVNIFVIITLIIILIAL